MSVADLIEAIDDPTGSIHPERHQALAQGEHPLARNPAFPAHRPQPGENASNYEELLASRQWKKILQKSDRYLGVPLTRQYLPIIHQKITQALALIKKVEQSHQEELEALAIHLVFELPEFASAKKAYESSRLKIDANLTGEVGEMEPEMQFSQDQQQEPQPPAPQRTPAEQEWMKKMVQRRHFSNAMIHGSAVSNDFLFELGGAALDRIHPGLRQAYGILMVGTEIGYWLFPQDKVIAGARGRTHVGSERLKVEQNKPVVKAKGSSLPTLIHEIVKGLLEVASLPGLPRDPAERKEVIQQADLLDLESWSMMMGPKLWDSFIEAVDANDERALAMHLYRNIQNMDVDQFNDFMREVLAKSPRGMQMLRELAAQIKSELAEEPQEESVADAYRVVNRLIEDETDEDDDEESWKDVENVGMPDLNEKLMTVLANLGIGPEQIATRYSDVYIMCRTRQEAEKIRSAGPWNSMAEIARTNPNHPDATTYPYLCDIPFANLGSYIRDKSHRDIGEASLDDEFTDDWRDVEPISDEAIRETLERLNWNYGRGRIESVDFDTNTVQIKKQYGTEVAHFKVVGSTVFFRGHQMAITPQ